MKKILMLLALLAGCEPPHIPDQCLRRELFKQCLAQLPAGPQRTHYNDMDEIVRACDDVAYYQSLKAENRISRACR